MPDSGHRGLITDLVGEVLLQRGRVCFTVTSSSMEPGIRVGDRVEVRQLAAGQPALGDVVLYRDPVLGHVLHRVLWRWPLWGVARSVYTKGDAGPYRDRRVDGGQVLGTVERVLRCGGDAEAGGLARRRRLLRSAGAMVLHRLGRDGGRAAGRPLTSAVADVETSGSPSEEPAGKVDSLPRRP